MEAPESDHAPPCSSQARAQPRRARGSGTSAHDGRTLHWSCPWGQTSQRCPPSSWSPSPSFICTHIRLLISQALSPIHFLHFWLHPTVCFSKATTNTCAQNNQRASKCVWSSQKQGCKISVLAMLGWLITQTKYQQPPCGFGHHTALDRFHVYSMLMTT